MTVRLNDIPWDQALDIVLQAQNLESEQEGNVLRISTVKRLREEREEQHKAQRAAQTIEPLQVAYLVVNYAKAAPARRADQRRRPPRPAAGRPRPRRPAGGGAGRPVAARQRHGRRVHQHPDRARHPRAASRTRVIWSPPRRADPAGADRVEHRRGDDRFRPRARHPVGLQRQHRAADRHQHGQQFPRHHRRSAAPASAPARAACRSWSISRPGRRAGRRQRPRPGARLAQRRLLARRPPHRPRAAGQGPHHLSSARGDAEQRRRDHPEPDDPARPLPSTGTVVNTGAGGSAGTATTATEKIETGITLEVTPQVSSDGFVLLDMFAKSSQADFTRTVDNIPTEITRQATSHVLVATARPSCSAASTATPRPTTTAACRGSRTSRASSGSSRAESKTKRREDLLVFLTPRVLKSASGTAGCRPPRSSGRTATRRWTRTADAVPQRRPTGNDDRDPHRLHGHRQDQHRHAPGGAPGGAFVDTDALVERAAGRRVAAIFASDGEAAFRAAERRAIGEALAVPGAVVATGGGAVVDPATRATLQAPRRRWSA